MLAPERCSRRRGTHMPGSSCMQFNCAVCGQVVHLGGQHEVRDTSAGRQFIHCECKSSQNKVDGEGASRASCTTQTKSIGHN